MTTAGKTHSAVNDGLRSVTGLISSSGAQVTSATYSAYGTPSTTSLAADAPAPSIGYASSYALPGSTGLNDMRARDYNPVTGQFTAVDPDLASTGVPYGYASDDPVAGTDPSGLCSSWNLFCRVIQPHWRNIAQGVVDVSAAADLGACTLLTDGVCAPLAPLVGAGKAAINNAIAGPGHQDLTDYEHAAVEGFVTNSIGLVCPACVSSPIAAASTKSGAGAEPSAIDYLEGTRCPTTFGVYGVALTGAAPIAPYPFEDEYYNYFMKKH